MARHLRARHFEAVDHDPVVRWLTSAAVLLLIVVLGWAVLITVSRPSVTDQLDRIQSQLTYLSCLALIPDDQRVESRVAECQVSPDIDLTPGG